MHHPTTRKINLLIILGILSLSAFSQDTATSYIKTLLETKEYDKIVRQYSDKQKDLSAKSLYYVGVAYYTKEDDANCLKFMDLSINKDATNPGPHYIKGMTLNYMGKFDDAVKCFNESIKLKADDAIFYSGLGDSYFNLDKTDKALEAYKKATEQPDCPGRPYSMIAQIYSSLNNTDKALESYYIAKTKNIDEPGSYSNALFNIGLLESQKGNYDKAEPAFLEIIKLDPADFHAYAKLIQVYYHRKEYEKAKAYKDKLYEAKKQGKLKGNLEDMFCFDQFKWNDNLIQAYERYEEGDKKSIYIKHLFYVLNQSNEIEFRIQTEYSPFAAEMSKIKYLLCMSKGVEHSTFNVGFNDDLKYDDLKAAVINVLEGKIQASASSRPGK